MLRLLARCLTGLNEIRNKFTSRPLRGHGDSQKGPIRTFRFWYGISAACGRFGADQLAWGLSILIFFGSDSCIANGAIRSRFRQGCANRQRRVTCVSRIGSVRPWAYSAGGPIKNLAVCVSNSLIMSLSPQLQCGSKLFWLRVVIHLVRVGCFGYVWCSTSPELATTP